MAAFPTWEEAPKLPRLRSNGLHVWRLDLDPNPEQDPPPRHLLSADERRRADRVRDSQTAARFVIARSALRQILGKYLRTDPRTLAFDYGARGKPMLASPHSWLNFNLSHSRELGLLGIAGTRAIGIDVEQLSPRPKLLEIARRVFTSEQIEQLSRAQGEAWLQEFYEIWTAMEARLKARGLGIFERDAQKDHPDLLIRHLRPHPGYMASVAVTTAPDPPTVWDFFVYPKISASE